MKTFAKLTRAVICALLATVVCVAMAVTLAACDNSSEPEGGNSEAVIKKYDATYEASVTMGPIGTYSMTSVFADTYVTDKDGSYTLTITFMVGEIEVQGIKGSIFVDDNPANPETVSGVKDGTIGVYNANGELVTEGVAVTYSSGDDYEVSNAGENVYYVKSAAMPVESLKEEYEICFYLNSAEMGKQFSKDTSRAKVKLDLTSGEVVSAISGLGVATRGVAPERVVITQYDATLDADVTMGPMGTYAFGDVLSAAYVTEKGGNLTLTLIFTTKTITVSSAKATLFVDDNPAGVNNVSFGVYDDSEELVTDGVTFTYGKGYVENSAGEYVSCVTSMQFPVESLEDTYYVDLYVHSDNTMGKKQFTKVALNLDLGSGKEVEKISGLGGEDRLDAPYAVTSMSFVVDEVAESYNLAVYVTAFNATSVSGMQFPYTSSKGIKSDAVLTITNNEGEYSAELHAVVNMGGSDVDFTVNLLKGIEVEELDEGGYRIILSFGFDTVNMPYNNVMTGYMNGASNKDYFGNVVEPEFGYYDNNGTLVSEGVTLTHS